MNAPIKQKGNVLFLLFAVSWSQFTVAGPVEVVVTADTQCRRGGSEGSTAQVRGKGRAGMLQGKNLRVGDYTTTMVEAFALAIKSLNETIVQMVNTVDYCSGLSPDKKTTGT